MAIPQSFIQDLLSRIDVVDVVGKYVQLKKGGANFMGLCPFHGEKSPSFSVSPSKQFFHCFGCGKSGNAIGFLMEHTGMSFIESVQDLAQQTGMVVPQDDQSPEDRARAAAQKARQSSLSDVLEKAALAYREQLKQAPQAIEYLKGRGLSGQVAKRFGLGYAPEGWRSLASVFPEYDNPLLAESGLVIVNAEDDKRYDRFRDRVMFPIRNTLGECIGFGGRVLGAGTPKYLNSPETPVFHKGRELYGLYEARQALHSAGYVLVTEGYMDVVALAQLGFANAVATLGTACTPEHVQKLFRFTDAVVFSFDGDAAGRRAARKALDGALPYASDLRSIKFLFLPTEHDPDSYVREHGADAFALCIAQAMPLSRFLIETASEGCTLGDAEGRARLSAQARPLWQTLPEGALKQQLLGELAQLIGLASADLAQLWQQQAAQSPRPHAAHTAHMAQAAHAARSASHPNGAGPAAQTRMAHSGGFAAPDAGHPSFEPHFSPTFAPQPSATSAAAFGLAHGPAWQPQADGPPAWGKGGKNAKTGHGTHGPRTWGAGRVKTETHPTYTGRRTLPASRADHAARLLLNNAALCEALAQEDLDMLCALPAPHGPLFAWLESQFHEHGALGASALLHDMQGQDFAPDAQRWLTPGPMAPSTAAAPPDPREARAELRHLLDLMLLDWIAQRKDQALADHLSQSNPDALVRYSQLLKRWNELKTQAQPGLG